MPVDVSSRSIGVNFGEQGATVKVWAPLAKSAAIEWNGKQMMLEKRDDGYWQQSISDLHPGIQYKFLLNGGKGLPDPASLAQPEGVHGPSKAIDLSVFRNSKQHSWINPPLCDYIIYELHTGTFSHEEDFQGIEKKLPELKNLGVTAIEIMPVAQFPGSRNWGYDGVYPFAVQHSYGGPEGLHRLIKSCHENDIAVILDVVYNHFGPEGNYVSEFGPFFTDKYHTPWGNAINFDDAWCDGVREFYIENALMWFRDFHVDALRLDAVHAIKDFSAVHILKDIKLHVDQLMQQTGDRHWLIVELDLNDPKYIDEVEMNGYGMNAQWIDEFHHALRVAAGERPSGYYSDFSGVTDLSKAFSDAYVFDGQFSVHRKKHFGAPATNHQADEFVVFSQNHDQVGNRPLGERSSTLYSFEKQKLMATAYLLSPYIPLIFMGEEWAETNPFLYFVSHSDPELCDAVRKGRRQEFADFFNNVDVEIPDPISEKTFQQSKLQWHLKDVEPHKTMFELYQHLIHLRKEHAILKNCNRKNLRAVCDEEKKLITIIRYNDRSEIILFLNFSDQAYELTEYSSCSVLLNTADDRWKGDHHITNDDGPNIIYPSSALLLERTL